MMHDLNNVLNESYKLEEGAKFGQKEVSDILSRSGDFNVGIEYEFNIDRERYDLGDVKTLLEKGFGIENIHSVVSEHDEMTEVITKKMNLRDGINNIKGMFKFLNSDLVEVRSFAGMHISISSNKYDMSYFNKSKFMVMLNSEYIHKFFPERRHVQNVNKVIEKSLKNFKRYSADRPFTEDAVDTIEDIISDALDTKYITATMKDFNMMDGRIELRFFGGENYQKMYADIQQQMLRALFIMELAYTDLYQKEYYKELYKLIKKDEPMKLKPDDKKNLLMAIKNEDTGRIINALLTLSDSSTPENTFNGLGKGLQKRIKSIFIKSPSTAFEFAEEILNGKRFLEGEPIISKDAEYSYLYSLLIRERFDEGESKIFSDLPMDTIENYIDRITEFNNYDKVEAIEMINNMPEDTMEELVSSVMDDRGQELSQDMGVKIFSLSPRSAGFAVEYLLNKSNVKNAESLAYEMNNAFVGNNESSLIDIDRVIEKVKTLRSASEIENTVSNIYLPDDVSIEILNKIFNIFENSRLDLSNMVIMMRVAEFMRDSVKNTSPEVVHTFEKLTGMDMEI